MRTRIVDGIEVTTSSGNVFADLGLPEAEKLKAESDRMIKLAKVEQLDPPRHPEGSRLELVREIEPISKLARSRRRSDR